MNDNENTNVFVSVPDLAEKIGTTEPRLRRYLKKPEFADKLGTIERTGTGTKTQTGVPVSLIPALKAALSSEKGQQEQKQKQSLSFPSEAGEATARYLAMMTAQLNERITEQAKTIEDLRVDKTELKQEREQLRGELFSLKSEVEDLRLIAATATGRITPRIAPGAPETGDTGGSPLATPPQAPGREPDAPTSAGVPGQVPAQQQRNSSKTAATGKPETGTDHRGDTPRKWWEFWKS